MESRGHLGERGVSVVVGAVLVIAIAIAAFASFYPHYARSQVHSREAEHAEVVRREFLDLKSKIEALSEGGSGSVSFPGTADSVPFVPSARRAGTLSVLPPRIVPASFQENYEGGIGDIGDAMWDDGIYENLWEKKHYQERSSDLETINTGTSVSGNNASTFTDGDGDVRQIDEAGSFLGRTLDVDYDFSLPAGVSKSDVASLAFKTDSWWTNDTEESCYIRAYDYNNSEWDQIDTLPTSETLRSISLNPDNYISTGGEMLIKYVQPDSSPLESTGRLNIDFHQMRVPAYRLDVGHTIADIPVADAYELQLEYYTAGDSENFDLKLYNFVATSWEHVTYLQGGTAADPENFTYSLTGTDYISGGEVRVRYLQQDNDATQTSLMVDYSRVMAENGLGSSSGIIEFRAMNRFFPDQWYVYEDDAVILVQDDTELMISPPSMISVNPNAPRDNIVIRVQRFVITGAKLARSTTGELTIQATEVSSQEVVAPLSEPNRENVILTISSPYENAWRDYLIEENRKLNAKGYNASLEGLTLTILGKNNTSGVRDIYYYETVSKIEVSVP